MNAKTKFVSTFALAMAAVTVTHAEVTLNVDDNIKVTAINGQTVNRSLLMNSQQQFKLEPGTQVITAKYDRLYEFRNGDHDYLRSGNITLTANLADNQSYRLVMPNQPEKYKEAKVFAESPTLAIMQGSRVLASQNGQASGSLLAGVGGAIGGLFSGSQSAVNSNNQAIAAVKAAAPIQAAPRANASTLDQFMQLWLNASEAEREKIRQWVSQ